MRIWARKDVPYFLTLVVALLGATVSLLAERIRSSPTIEYSIITGAASSTGSIVYIEIQNVSRTVAFANVHLRATATDGSVWDTAAYNAVPPAILDDELEIDANRNTVNLTVPKLHPGWEVVLALRSDRPSPTVDFGLVSSEVAIRMVKRGPETFLARNETAIIGALSVLWLCIIIGYVVFLPAPSVPPVPRGELSGVYELSPTSKLVISFKTEPPE
jgi:hypothetical protein